MNTIELYKDYDLVGNIEARERSFLDFLEETAEMLQTYRKAGVISDIDMKEL